jgi:hypothetical protein
MGWAAYNRSLPTHVYCNAIHDNQAMESA